jgi:hypothetical protein
LLFSSQVSAQHAIRASRAIAHVGENRVIVDSIYNIKINGDSTVYLDLGRTGGKAALVVVVHMESGVKFDKRALNDFKMTVLEVTGNIVLVANQPYLVVSKKGNIFFFSPDINRKWLVLYQTSVPHYQIASPRNNSAD